MNPIHALHFFAAMHLRTSMQPVIESQRTDCCRLADRLLVQVPHRREPRTPMHNLGVH